MSGVDDRGLGLLPACLPACCLRALLFCGLGLDTAPLHRISSVNYGSEITPVWPACLRTHTRRIQFAITDAISKPCVEPLWWEEEQRRWTGASSKLRHFEKMNALLPM